MKHTVTLFNDHRPSIEVLSEHLDYSPDTGLLTWLLPGKRRHVGGTAGSFSLSRGYVSVQVLGYRTRAHRVAWALTHGTWPVGEIDHINGIRSDNRLCNLRDVSRSVNQQNKRHVQRNSTLGVLGVSPGRRGKFVAFIKLNGRTKNLGEFVTLEEAKTAYLSAKRLLHPGWAA